MDYVFEQNWKQTVSRISDWAGGPVDLQGILFLIGVQELGSGFRTFKKDEKLGLMHIAICTLLAPDGYYSFIGRDEDGWPHFERNTKLPSLTGDQQDRLMRERVMTYFHDRELISGPDKTV